MADLVMVNNQRSTTADTIEEFFTAATAGASGKGARITAFTASNNTTSCVSYKAYIYDSAGAAVGAIVPMKIVVKDKFDSASSAVNQTIPAGGTLRAENSTASALNFYMSGLEQVASS